MIEIFGIKLTYEAIGFIIAFAASEIIGESKLKQNSVLALVKSLIDTLRPARKEDEKIEAIKARIDALIEEVEGLGK